MNRASYASGDAVALAERHWDFLPDFIKEQFRDDLEMHARVGVLGPPEEVLQRWGALFER